MGAQASQLTGGHNDPVHSFENYNLYNSDKDVDDPDQTSMFLTAHYKPECGLDKNALQLKKYRHPSILHFVSWDVHSKVACLVTERVNLLSPTTLSENGEEALCLGLLEILQALDFLHTSGVCHGNISQASIFITSSGGRWRLGGLEEVSPSSDTGVAKDIQALGLVITEILANCKLDTSVKFRDYVKSNLMLPDIKRIPSAKTILHEPFFNQPCCKLFSFLTQFPVHSNSDKIEFFKSATSKLKTLSASMVSKHLLPLLLSRYIIMDSSAQEYLTPNLLIPKSSASLPSHIDPILPLSVFQTDVVPQLKLLFMVPDTSIRLHLLHLWPHLVHHIDQGDLQQVFLPYILQGMRDTDPALVSATLRCLADLVPILGPEIVVGSNRSKIFHDRSPTKIIENTENICQTKEIPDLKGSEINNQDFTEEWEDWKEDNADIMEDSSSYNPHLVNGEASKEVTDEVTKTEIKLDYASNVEKIIRNVQDLDIMKLDVKAAKVKSVKVDDDELDYFSDMTPNITRKTSALDLYEAELKQNVTKKDMFAAIEVNGADDNDNGWGDDEW